MTASRSTTEQHRAALEEAIRSGAAMKAVLAAADKYCTSHIDAMMQHRAVIEQAKGILMGQRRCSADEAFTILRALSQGANRKLSEVAEALVKTAVGPA